MTTRSQVIPLGQQAFEIVLAYWLGYFPMSKDEGEQLLVDGHDDGSEDGDDSNESEGNHHHRENHNEESDADGEEASTDDGVEASTDDGEEASRGGDSAGSCVTDLVTLQKLRATSRALKAWVDEQMDYQVLQRLPTRNRGAVAVVARANSLSLQHAKELDAYYP